MTAGRLLALALFAHAALAGEAPRPIAAGERVEIAASDGSGVLALTSVLAGLLPPAQARSGQTLAALVHAPGTPEWWLRVAMAPPVRGGDGAPAAPLPSGAGHVLGQAATWQPGTAGPTMQTRTAMLNGWAGTRSAPGMPRVMITVAAGDAALLARLVTMVEGMQWQAAGAVPDKPESRPLAANQVERIAIAECAAALTVALPMAATVTVKPAAAPATRIIELAPAGAGVWRITLTVGSDAVPRETGTYDQVLGSEVWWQQSGLTATTVVPRQLGIMHGREFLRPRLALSVTGANPAELKALLEQVRAMRWTPLAAVAAMAAAAADGTDADEADAPAAPPAAPAVKPRTPAPPKPGR